MTQVMALEDRALMTTFTVTNLSDSGAGSLRDAISLANTNGNAGTADLIDFAPGLSGTLWMNGTDMDITEDLTIIGNVTTTPTGIGNKIIIDAQNQSRIFDTAITAGNFTLKNLTLENGNASTTNGLGGAIYHRSTGVLVVSQSTLSHNQAIGNGGAIHAVNALVNVSESTLSGNTAGRSGGAIFAAAGADVSECTISGNSARDGGGIFVISFSALEQSTITGNTALAGVGGGIAQGSSTSSMIRNSIVAGNSNTGAPDIHQNNVNGGTLSVSYSLIGDNTGTTLSQAQTVDGNGNYIGASSGAGIIIPLLGPLASNGGPTNTCALLPGSLAINSGNNTFASIYTNDQRLTGYSRIVGGTVDMGAFEVQAIPNPDPNDQVSEATPMLIGECLPADIGLNAADQLGGNDVDMYSFTVTAGQTLFFDVDHLAPWSLNSYIRLFDAAGAQLSIPVVLPAGVRQASNNNAVGPGAETANEAYLLWTFPTAGTYYVGVSSNANTAYSATAGTGDAGGTPTGQYSLQIGNAYVQDDGEATYFFAFPPSTPWSVGAGWIGPAGGGADTKYALGAASPTHYAKASFTGLAAGTYRVTATYRFGALNSTAASYNLFGGGTPAPFTVNQAVAPNDFDFAVAGGNVRFFETIGTVTVNSSGNLDVELSNQAAGANIGKRVFADGFVVEQIDCLTPSSPPDAEVCDVTTPVADDTGLVSFGATNPGVPVYKTFTVKNVGTSPLTVQPVTVTGTGFVVQTNLAANTVIPPAGTATFTVCFSGTTAGNFSGTVSFVTDDPASPTYDFNLTATVNAVPMIQVCEGPNLVADNTGLVDFGCVDTCVNTYKVITVKNTGTAPLTVQPVTVTGNGYSVSTNLAVNTVIAPNGTATFTICFTGTANGTFAGTVSFNTDDPNIAVYNFNLSAKIDVRYLDNGPDSLAPYTNDPGFTADYYEGWYGATGGRCGAMRWAYGASTATTFATWTFGSLTVGATYQVWASWKYVANQNTVVNATNAHFNATTTATNGMSSADAHLNQRVNADDLHDLCDPLCPVAGSHWESIGTVTIGANGVLVVTLSNEADGRVFADSIRIACV